MFIKSDEVVEKFPSKSLAYAKGLVDGGYLAIILSAVIWLITVDIILSNLT